MTSSSTGAEALARGHASRALSTPTLVLLLALAHVLLWGGAQALTWRAPALDSAEQLAWSYALEGGYWKHPPLPSWLLHGLAALFGRSIALPAVAAQACAALALALCWRVGSAVLGPRDSLAAMALSGLVAWHTVGAQTFNHNTVLLPVQAACVLATWFALRRGLWWQWMLAGLCAALAMLVKYAALFTLASLAVYVLLDRSTWTRRNVAGLLVAAATFAAVVAPHLQWLFTHELAPVLYARAVTLHARSMPGLLASLALFLGEQLLRLLPLLAVLGWLWRRRHAMVAAPAPPLKGDRLFLWIVGAGPLVLTLAYSLATGTVLLPRWGGTVFLFAGWLLLDALRHRWTPAWPEVLRAAAVAQLVSCLLAGILAPWLGDVFAGPGRARFPAAILNARAQETWNAYADTPLRLVISDAWTGGNLAAFRPLAVQLDGDPWMAPWVAPGDIASCGALVLVNHNEFRGGVVPPHLAARLAGADERGEWVLPWAEGAAVGVERTVRISWGVIEPDTGRNCTL